MSSGLLVFSDLSHLGLPICTLILEYADDELLRLCRFFDKLSDESIVTLHRKGNHCIEKCTSGNIYSTEPMAKSWGKDYTIIQND